MKGLMEVLVLFLICKIEDEFIPTLKPLPKKKRLKISTLIVDHVGYKIGELLLRVAIDEALKNDIFEMYLTHFTEENDRLVDLIHDYGFYSAGIIEKNGKKEDVFLKHLTSENCDISGLDPQKLSAMFFPSFCDKKKFNKYIIPIIPIYHDRLFSGYKCRQTSLNEHFGEFAIEGNTIKKVYLTRSKIKKISSGDIIFFYRSHDKKSITSLGVVEFFYHDISDIGEISKKIGKRSVYTSEEIQKMKKPLAIIIFRHHFYIKEIKFDSLMDSGILSGCPQSIIQISHQKYEKLIKLGEINERFIIH
ncbi:putative RNA-binding protein with PUA-like domain [Methanomicrobium sp. W14]|nr:putative RNA-binding protein with PUA-like domain [Methanomicrobium sp. W14]